MQTLLNNIFCMRLVQRIRSNAILTYLIAHLYRCRQSPQPPLRSICSALRIERYFYINIAKISFSLYLLYPSEYFLCQSTIKKSFSQSSYPTLQYLSPESSYHKSATRPHEKFCSVPLADFFKHALDSSTQNKLLPKSKISQRKSHQTFLGRF